MDTPEKDKFTKYLKKEVEKGLIGYSVTTRESLGLSSEEYTEEEFFAELNRLAEADAIKDEDFF